MRKYWFMIFMVVLSAATAVAIDSIATIVAQKPKVQTSRLGNPSVSVDSYGVMHVTNSCDIAGVSNPALVSAEKCGLRDNDLVIGVNAFGESRAFVRGALEGLPERHVVNVVMGAIPVTITHCDRTQCTRVLTTGNANDAVAIRCGGWLPAQEMSLLVGDQEYAHSSSKIPLKDLGFVVSTWKDWREKNPDSMVYLGHTSETAAPAFPWPSFSSFFGG